MKHLKYNSPDYWQALSNGLISWEQAEADQKLYEVRRDRSLQTCHRFSAVRFGKKRYPKPETRAYTPETSACVDEDRNLTANAANAVRFLMRYAYQKARDTRTIRITVSYIAKGLKRCCRSVQRYLRALEEEGYISTEIVRNAATGMVECLEITLLSPLFPDHHKEKWPYKLEKPGNPDATVLSDKQSHIYIYTKESVSAWALRCMNGVFDTFMKRKSSFETKDPYPI